MNMLSLIAAKGLRSFSKSSPAKTANRATDTSTSLMLEVPRTGTSLGQHERGATPALNDFGQPQLKLVQLTVKSLKMIGEKRG